MIQDNIGTVGHMGCGCSAMPLVALDDDESNTGIVIASSDMHPVRAVTGELDHFGISVRMLARELARELAMEYRANNISSLYGHIGRTFPEFKHDKGKAYKVYQANKWSNKYSSKRI